MGHFHELRWGTSGRSLLWVAVWFACIAGASETAVADADSDREDVERSQESERYRLGAGDVDLGASVGIGRRIRFEPILSVGLVSIGDTATISTGLTAGFGFGLLCPIVDTLLEGCRRSVRDVIPKWRLAIHSGLPGDVIGYPFALYAGGSVGPSVYFYRVRQEDTVHRPGALTTTVQVFGGARLFTSRSGRFFGFAEARLRFEQGDHRVRVPRAGGEGDILLGDDYLSRALNTVVGGGFRF